jgi:hypothetical protein
MIPQFSRPVWSVLVLLAISWCASGQETTKTSSQSPEVTIPTTVSFCQLVSKPELYNGKELVIQASYTHGYEWSVLHSPDCSDKGMVWLDLSRVRNNAAVKSLGPLTKPETVNLEVQGTFMSGGHYGHRNQYPHQIVAHKVSAVEVVQKPPAEK